MPHQTRCAIVSLLTRAHAFTHLISKNMPFLELGPGLKKIRAFKILKALIFLRLRHAGTHAITPPGHRRAFLQTITSNSPSPKCLVLGHAHAILRTSRGQTATTRLQPFTVHYTHLRTRHLGHILRAPSNDPLRASVLDDSHKDLVTLHRRRVGRPRNTWLQSAACDAWLMTDNCILPPAETLLAELLDRATRRVPPFRAPAPH